jgi:hypothetical protein
MMLILSLHSLSIIGVDTWLHVSTKSVPMPYLAHVNPTEAGTAYQFSRALTEICREDDHASPFKSNITLPCSVSVSGSGSGIKSLHSEAINSMLLGGPGSSDTIYQDTTSGLSFIGASSRTSVPFVLDKTTLSPHFTASTFATNTTCSLNPICIPKIASQNDSFVTCDAKPSRNNPAKWFALAPWENTADVFNSDSWTSPGNLAQWAVYAPYPSFHIEPVNNRLIVNSDSDPVEGSSAFVLMCTLDLYTIEYEWANDTTTRIDFKSANTTLQNIVNGLFISNYSFTDDHLKSFSNRLNIGLGPEGHGNYTEEDYSRRYAALLREIGLSFLAGSIEPRPATKLQVQNETIITQVPKSALFVLIFLNLWYAFIGFCLFLAGYLVTFYNGRRADVQAVQELLTVIGLTTAAVSKDRSAQGKNVRIGVEKTEDEWRFKIWHQEEAIEDIEHSAQEQKLEDSPSLKASKSQILVRIVSCNSNHSRDAADDIALTSCSTGSQYARDVVPPEDGSVSPATTSTSGRSLYGDPDQMQLISQTLLLTSRLSQDSNDTPTRTSSPDVEASCPPERNLSPQISANGSSTHDDISLLLHDR